MAKSQFSLIGALSKLEKAKRGKDQMLGLLAHYQMQKDGEPDEDETAKQ
jgi:hypothetical protein